MAFYSVRVDDNGKEIETTRNTYRKVFKNNNVNEDDEQEQAFKTVRFINSATFIEKVIEPVKKPCIPVIEEPNETESDLSDNSNFSLDIDDKQYKSHHMVANESIPVLELNSNESFPSSNNLSYSYRRVCEATKIIRKPDAYREWLAAKKTAKIFEDQRKRQQEEKEAQEKEEKKTIAQEKYQLWLQKKIKAKENVNKLKKHQSCPNITKESEPTSFIKPHSKEANFEKWLERKLQREKANKEKQKEDLKLEEQKDTVRREEATNVYKKWLKTAPYKPKPVPLNQGLLTLKGTLSEIYVNPIPWVSVDSNTTSDSH